MLQQLFNIWLRTLSRYRLYTFINIAGLSFGICAVVAIFIYVTDELSFDKFNARSERIYRINTTTNFNGNETSYPSTAAPLAEAIRNDLSSSEKTARMFERQASIQLMDGNRPGDKFRQDHAWFADPEVFDIFTFEFIAGNKNEALTNPGQLAISHKVAVKYFGGAAQAIGRDVLFEGRVPFVVSAVFADLPQQTSFPVEMVAHFENYYNLESEGARDFLKRDWLYNPLQTFVLLREGINPNDFTNELTSLRQKYGDERVIKSVTYQLQSLDSIHLYSIFTYEDTPAIRYIYILASIGFVILLIACVNFINLANVHSLKRAREIGVRKVMGAQKGSLVLQFITESGLLVMISFVLGVILLYSLLPYINTLSGKNFSASELISWKLLGGIATLFVVTSLLAGTYPSFYITRFNPIVVLKGLNAGKSSEGYMLRKVLMTMQFTISVVLIVLSIVFWQQMQFIHDKPLGFQTTNVVAIPLFSDSPNSILGGGVDGPLRQRMNAFETELSKHADVDGVTVSSMLPGMGAGANALVQTDKIKAEDNIFMAMLSIDYDFINTYNMELVAGRDFSRDAGTDHLQAYIINEQAVRLLGFTDPSEAVGTRLQMLDKNATIIGVVKDFHFQGLQNALSPMALEVAAGRFTIFSVNLSGGTPASTGVETIRTEWNKAFPEKVFEFHFLDERLELNYGREQQMVNMMQCFSILAIVISALGLFGLAAYVNHQRSKEVSIRKILGANVSHIFLVLSKEFVVMAVIAFAIATPIAWMLASQWLDSFAYRAGVGIFAMIAGGLLLLTIVFITISYETIKSARVNPVDKLRE